MSQWHYLILFIKSLVLIYVMMPKNVIINKKYLNTKKMNKISWTYFFSKGNEEKKVNESVGENKAKEANQDEKKAISPQPRYVSLTNWTII